MKEKSLWTNKNKWGEGDRIAGEEIQDSEEGLEKKDV
jgi:hypothetical protein